MAIRSSELAAARSSLSRRVGIHALAGLALIVGFAAGFLVVAGVLLDRAVGAFISDLGAVGVLWLLGTVLFAWLAFRCLAWLAVVIGPPEGVELPRDAARSLYRLVDRVGARFGNARIDSVWVTGGMNAAIQQRPRWGLVGPMENHLLIGLPLAHSVNERQLVAIVAHEFAHLAYQRQGLGAWGCHTRAWWFRALSRCLDDLPAGLSATVERWTERSLLLAQELARLEEFEADRAAARVVGRGLVGEALTEVALKERFLAEDYWEKVMAQSTVLPRPSIRPYREMGHGMAAGFRASPEASNAFLRSTFADPDGGDGLHPTLAERLDALGVVPIGARAEERSAAARHLESVLPQLSWIFDRVWWMETRISWRSCYRSARRR
jgi:hypothetical protein